MKGKITSLDPPMVTAEVEKPGGTSCMCWLCTSWYNTKLQEYHKAIEPMPVENAHKIESSGYTFVLFAKYGDPFTLKLHQKVEFTKTETGCRITKIVNQ